MPFPKRINKYVVGAPIENIHHLIERIMVGGWIYADGRLTSPGFAGNWSLATLRGLTRNTRTRAANINPEWTAQQAMGCVLETVF